MNRGLSQRAVPLYFVVAHMHNKSFTYFSFFFFTGCQLILGHAVDRDLLLLVQGKVRGLIKDYNTFEKNLATLRDQDKRKGTVLDEHQKNALKRWKRSYRRHQRTDVKRLKRF